MIRIDIEDASGNRKGGGPLVTVGSLARTRELDRIGGIKFPVPATDPRSAEIRIGRHYKVYHKILGYLGEFIHQDTRVKTGEHPVLEVVADDLLRELAWPSCLFNREYSVQYLGVIVTNLLTLASGWSGGSVANVGYTSTEFQGESVLNAIMSLAEGGGAHFRLGTATRTLDFGGFGVDSGIRCMGVDVVGPELEDNDALAIISDIEISSEGGSIVNRLVPLGAGEGETRLTLAWTTITDPSYPVQNALNPDGSTYYYIEDTTSQTAYGVIVAPYTRSDIRPLSNTDVDMINAANALYNTALAALLRRKDPDISYRLSVRKLRGSLRPGQTVQVVYRGMVTYDGTPYKYVDLNTDMYVLSIEDQFKGDGSIEHRLEVSEAGFRPVSDTGVVTQMHRDIEVIMGRVQPSISYNKVGPYLRDLVAATYDAVMDVRIGPEVLLLNHAKLRFATSPFRVRSGSVASGGGSTQSSASGGGGSSGASGNHDHIMFSYQDDTPPATTEREYQCVGVSSPYVYVALKTDQAESLKTSGMSANHTHTLPTHTHQVTIPAHTHPMTYGIYEDTHYPQNIRIHINGIDRTVALGGPWATTDAAVEVEVDITDYLANASGGLRQVHEIKFTVSGGTNNQGSIDMQVDMLCTIQAIAV
jgi:uncharacterized membrane protein YgcG